MKAISLQPSAVSFRIRNATNNWWFFYIITKQSAANFGIPKLAADYFSCLRAERSAIFDKLRSSEAES